MTSLEELRKVDDASHELSAIGRILFGDIQICTDAFKIGVKDYKLNQSWRRTLVKNLFAAIEGVCHQYKRLALRTADISLVQFTDAEKTLLNEQFYSLNNNGEAESVKAKLRTADNLIFGFRMAVKSCKEKFTVDKSSKGWESFKKALKVRDRITHPKGIVDLNISDDEMDFILETGMWFSKDVGLRVVEMFSNFYKEHRKSRTST